MIKNHDCDENALILKLKCLVSLIKEKMNQNKKNQKIKLLTLLPDL